jgi:hypothetical protein
MACWCLLLLLALCSSAQCATPSDTSVVSTPGQLRQALLAPGVSTVVLSRQLLLDPQLFEPLAVARPVKVTSDTGHAILGFGSATQPLINVAAGGALSLHGLTLAGFYPADPLAYTTATSMMPLSAVSVSSSDAVLSVSSCTLLVDGPATKLTATMPFWQVASQQGSLAGASTRAPNQQQQQQATVTASDGRAAEAPAAGRSLVDSASDMQQQVLELPLIKRSYFDGNSSISLQDTIIALDPNSCYDGSRALAWNSASLSAALQGEVVSAAGSLATSSSSSSSNVLVFTDIVLDPLHFTQLRAAPIPSVNVSGCVTKPASLNFNSIAQAVTLQQGARMVLGNGLRLLQAASLDEPSGASIDSAALLVLGSVDVSAGAELLLHDLVVVVPDSSSVQQAMRDVAKQHAASSSTPSLQELSAAEAAAVAVPGGDGPAFLVNAWGVDLAALELHEGAAAAAKGKSLTKSARVCSSGSTAIAISAAALHACKADEQQQQEAVAVDDTDVCQPCAFVPPCWTAERWIAISCVASSNQSCLHCCFALTAAAAAAGSKLVLDSVTLEQVSAQPCFPSSLGSSSGSSVAVAADDMQLSRLLVDADVSMIQITGDMQLHAARWKVRLLMQQRCICAAT